MDHTGVHDGPQDRGSDCGYDCATFELRGLAQDATMEVVERGHVHASVQDRASALGHDFDRDDRVRFHEGTDAVSVGGGVAAGEDGDVQERAAVCGYEMILKVDERLSPDVVAAVAEDAFASSSLGAQRLMKQKNSCESDGDDLIEPEQRLGCVEVRMEAVGGRELDDEEEEEKEDGPVAAGTAAPGADDEGEAVAMCQMSIRMERKIEN
ncbi:hypothetical protein BGZ83_001371 [Gryganskiella cystojenkinii]|nr:hypothetical protein BGZ83_001371 [Gryganskiella cystojenkinii]